MNAKDAIKTTIDMCHMILTTYLSDLNDAELMIRAVPEANHIAWQLGHLIAAEQKMMTDAGVTMPELPDGFAEAYTPETAGGDDASKFHTKDRYLELLAEQRESTLNALAAASNADLDKPTPEAMKEYAPTLGAAFNIVGIHTCMHAPQFIAVRRKLGKPVLI